MNTPDTSVTAAAATTRTYVIPNFGTNELEYALRLFEELARTLTWWEQDAQQEPDGDGWQPPAACSGPVLNELHTRLWQALRPTQTRQEYRDHGRERVDVEPDGPEWSTLGGYGLANLYFVELRTADLQALAALAAALADPKLDSGVREAVDDVNEREVDDSGSWEQIEKRRETHGAAAAVVHLNALLSVVPDPDDITLLQAARTAAGDSGHVRLGSAAEAAWHRVADACTQALIAGTNADRVLSRWAMGSRDHT